MFGSLGVAGVLIFSLITAGGSVSSLGPVVIWGTLDDTQIRAVLREAVDADQRFSEVSYVKKDPALYDAELKDALANGKGPDLFIMRQDYAHRDRGYTIRIPFDQFSQSQFRSTFLDAAEPFLAEDGVVAVPILVDPLVLFWNKDALATAGIASPPQYWNQVPEMVQQLVKMSDSGTVVRGGIALGSFDNIPAAKDIITAMILQAEGSITAYDRSGRLRPSLSSQGGSTGAVTALNFYTEFANPAQPDYSWSRAFKDARSSFAAGDVAMYIGHASDKALIAELNPNLDFAMAALPQIRSAAYALNNAHVYGLALSRTSQNARGAITVAYLMAAENMIQPIAQSLGMTSSLRRVISETAETGQTNPAVTAQQNALQGLLANAPKTDSDLVRYEASISKSWVDPDPDKTDEVFRDMIESTVSGARKAAEAVQRADKQIAEILKL